MIRFCLYRRLLMTVFCLLLSAFYLLPSAKASKVKVWHQYSPGHFDKAKFQQAVVTSEGALRLSRQLKPFANLDASHCWDAVEDKDGNLFVATGDEGKIFKVTAEGQVSVAFDSEESQILCLALAADGSIYAGTGPSGLIVRIRPTGNARVIYDSPETYVWSLAVDPKGHRIYAGTGPKGRIYEVTPAGKATIFYQTKQEHILSLAMGPDGMLYAGTDKNGLVYRIDRKGKGFVLYNAPQAEVHSLLVTADGVYAGTSSPARRNLGPSTALGSRLAPAMHVGVAHLSPARSAAGTAAAGTVGSSPPGSLSQGGDKSPNRPLASPLTAGQNSLYRIAFDGTVREVFREKAMILSLLRANGHIFIGTGMEGRLFEMNKATREHSEIARLDHGQIHCLCRRRDGSIALGTGDPGKLYLLQDKYTAAGTVLSDVLDAKIISKWSSLRWRAETPPGTSVSLAVRSGNVSEPDETWSNWSAEETNSHQATIKAPTARFLQYRVTLKTDNPELTPTVHSLTLRYMTTNQAPEVTAIEVPDVDAANLNNSKKLKFKWTAADPNDDDLTFHLYVRKDGWKSWVQLEDNWDKKEYEWDTTTTPSGTYRLKVVASDRKDNPAEDALTAERISSPFVVAHTPPAVVVKVVGMDGERAIIQATATDPLVRLTSAAFAVNGKKWMNVFPTDGLFDNKKESFRFKTAAIKPGTYVLVLRVTDAAGNTGSGDVVFTVKTQSARR